MCVTRLYIAEVGKLIFANLIMPTCHIGTLANVAHWQARKTTLVDLRYYSFAREGIVVFSR